MLSVKTDKKYGGIHELVCAYKVKSGPYFEFGETRALFRSMELMLLQTCSSHIPFRDGGTARFLLVEPGPAEIFLTRRPDHPSGCVLSKTHSIQGGPTAVHFFCLGQPCFAQPLKKSRVKTTRVCWMGQVFCVCFSEPNLHFGSLFLTNKPE